ncbi:MAG TPA: hypothetical protein VGB79_01845 [Allosphingosinicella sp.]|jgi:hypothetical protein
MSEEPVWQSLDRSPMTRQVFERLIEQSETILFYWAGDATRPSPKAGPMVAAIMTSTRTACIDREEARLLGYRRVVFALDHPEFEIEVIKGGLRFVSEAAEVHFRLACC